jgi:hypothetical protein
MPFFIACNRSGVPDGVIPPDKMTPLMEEVYIADGRISAYQQLPDTLYKYGNARYQAIFKKFDVDSAQFRKSYVYYSSDPQQLLDMNTKILADLQIKSDSLNKLVRIQQMKNPEVKPGASAPQVPPLPAGQPVSTFHPSQPPGAAPVAVPAAPTRVVPYTDPKLFAAHMKRFKAIQDSMIKAKLKKQHAGSN